jgi:stage III sporulation protein AA
MITAKRRPTTAYEQAVEFLPRYKDKLLAVSPAIREKAREIRLRAGQAIAVEHSAVAGGANNRHFIDAAVTRDDLKNLIELFCGYSVHSYARQLAQGFITLEGGHRAGFCGTAVIEDSSASVKAIREITSINLRIAREFAGCSDELYSKLHPESLKSLLIIGRPMSAKTTVLRDFARNLSAGGYKVSIIDERGELAVGDLGANCDILGNFPKKAGFITALRALSPDFIICDEIADDGKEIGDCLNSGTGVIMTAHCGSLEEALNSSALSGVIKHLHYVALLGTGVNIGKLQGLWKKDLKSEVDFSDILSFNGHGIRLIPLSGA